MVRGILFLMIVVMVIFLVLFDPADIPWLGCNFYRLTGIPCPTCGISRSFHAMVNFRISDAFVCHWLGPLLFMAMMFTGLFFGITAVCGKSVSFQLSTRKAFAGLAGIVLMWLLVWVIRILSS